LGFVFPRIGANCDATITRRKHPGAEAGGDCDNGGTVSINELVLGVSIALGGAPLDACPAFDQDGSGQVEINELVAATRNALAGCDADRLP